MTKIDFGFFFNYQVASTLRPTFSFSRDEEEWIELKALPCSLESIFDDAMVVLSCLFSLIGHCWWTDDSKNSNRKGP